MYVVFSIIKLEISIHALLAESDQAVLSRHSDQNISIHALLAESDRSRPRLLYGCRAFLSTLSLRRATFESRFRNRQSNISIHALLAESDYYMDGTFELREEFLSTLSLRRATSPRHFGLSIQYYFYPRSPCGERLHAVKPVFVVFQISIHALLAESDFHIFASSGFDFAISIHALLAESDADKHAQSPTQQISIHALLAESDALYAFYALMDLISIHALCAGIFRLFCISIHALLAESDRLQVQNMEEAVLFLSTLSLRRATQRRRNATVLLAISIHALLAESDATNFRNPSLACLISIHALLAESDASRFHLRATFSISIHALLAESDHRWMVSTARTAISIHALLAESDPMRRCKGNPQWYFYPRSPCGERPRRTYQQCEEQAFLSTLSLRRATAKVHKTVGHFCAYGTNFMGIASSC